MSLYDYQRSCELTSKDVPFDALIMAAIRRADGYNLLRLEAAFPHLVDEVRRRYNSPGGILPEEQEHS